MAAQHELRIPNRNKRGERTRADLLEAAWRVIDRMSLVELLAGLTPTAVASEAGLTTGAFRHHFGDTDHLVAALVAHHLERGDLLDLERVAADVAEGRSFDAATVRAFAVEVWEQETCDEAAKHRRRRALLSLDATETTLSSGEQMSDLLVDRFWRPYFEMSGPIVSQALDAIGRVPISPFRNEDIVRLVRAVLDGLVAQSILEPGVIDAQLYADALTGVLVTLTAPVGRGESLADLEAGLRAPSRSADTTDLEQLQDLAISALGLFDRNLEEVTFSQIASATGASVQVLVQHYGTVRRVAAIAFAEVLPRVDASASRHLIKDPMRALADTLCDIARMAQRYPHVAAALLFERSEQALAAVEGRHGGTANVFTAVPIDEGVARALSVVPGSDLLDVAALSADMVDLTLLYAGTRTWWAPADVAARALSLLPFLPDNKVSSSK